MNEWSYTSTPHIHLHGVDKEKLHFDFDIIIIIIIIITIRAQEVWERQLLCMGLTLHWSSPTQVCNSAT